MDVNLVSSNQWAGVYTYARSQGYTFIHAGLGKAANHPVQTVDWFDCVKWCNARSPQAGLTPVYYTDIEFDAGVHQWGQWHEGVCELVCQWVSVADGSGVGEGGTRGVDWSTVSVGQHDFRKPGEL